MSGFLTESVYLGVVLTLGAYYVGLQIRKRWNYTLLNPILLAVLLIMAVLLLAKIPYTVYYSGAKYISYLMTPATVCLAIPLYEQLETLKKHRGAILAGIVAGVLTSLTTVLLLAMLFRLDHAAYVTLLPKSVTTPIGMGISQELGGYVSITVAMIVLTGILGNVLAEKLCRWFGITEPVAKGIGIGSGSHALGTVKAMEMGEVEGAMSSLSIALSGILTVFAAAVFAAIY